jgi:excisionase family DNA binding protein
VSLERIAGSSAGYDISQYHDNMAVDPEALELTVRQAANLVHRDPETIRRWVRGGRLSHRRVGTTILVHRGDLLELVASFDDVEMLPLPWAWQKTHSGAPMPNLAAAVQRSRAGR